MKLKKLIFCTAVLVFLCAAICTTAAAADNYFDASFTIEQNGTDLIISVPDSPVLQEKNPSLKLAFSGTSASILHGGTVVPATVQDGYVTFQVSEAGTYIIAEGSYSAAITTVPSCTDDGEYTYTNSDNTKSYTEDIPATGHDFTDVNKKTCANCCVPNPNYVPNHCGFPLKNPFTDISKQDYYYHAVLWAARNGITTGQTETLFAPGTVCTRAQVVTFLWRAAGSPASALKAHGFTDVAKGAYYENAILWAVEKGITLGTTTTTFSPDETVTRAQAVTFLWRAAGYPAVKGTSSFSDVANNTYYARAVDWAVQTGITMGTHKDLFSPEAGCTRAQIVTFLYRQYKN